MSQTAERDVRDLRVVITGATSGIGEEIARGLVQRGAAVTIVARNKAKADAVATELAAGAAGAPAPEVVLADLGDLASVRRAAAELDRRHDRIDVLVNNAGLAAMSPSRSADGFELMMATNHLGPFLLTNLLLGKLGKAGSARIVGTASEAHRLGGRPQLRTLADPLDYGALGGQAAYGRSKLMNVLFTAELARRLDGLGVTANCFCPGLVATGLTRDVQGAQRVATFLARTPFVRRPEQGARMGLRLVLDPALDGVSGQFFTSTPGARLLPSVAARNDARYQRELWDRSAELVGLPT
ncbi:SDR family NAD(P)-dependent oxidoreductase [Pseudonocardia sp. Cha107L01]|uniref:SDR family NAD(P)-dependent oxidoreductase n=1 Tax=Pseudonocardia sp. Cha107L01 TaxID=3457576 RepID=UPI00403E7D1B